MCGEAPNQTRLPVPIHILPTSWPERSFRGVTWEQTMNRAAILGFYFLSFGLLTPNGQSAGQPTAATSADSSAKQGQSSASASQQAPPAQRPESTQPASATVGQTSNPPAQAKPSPKQSKHHKKTVPPPDCASAPTPMNTAVGSPTDATKTTNADSNNAGLTDGGSTNAGSTDGGSTNAASTNAGSAGAASTNTSSTALPPCPPPKKVVRNGGSDEPSIQLVGGETAEQSAHQSATDRLTFATEENLKKMAGHPLSPSQQEMVSQIKLFMDQSKTAIAAGDVERGRNLAMKAHLLSDELVKP